MTRHDKFGRIIMTGTIRKHNVYRHWQIEELDGRRLDCDGSWTTMIYHFWEGAKVDFVYADETGWAARPALKGDE